MNQIESKVRRIKCSSTHCETRCRRRRRRSPSTSEPVLHQVLLYTRPLPVQRRLSINALPVKRQLAIRLVERDGELRSWLGCGICTCRRNGSTELSFALLGNRGAVCGADADGEDAFGETGLEDGAVTVGEVVRSARRGFCQRVAVSSVYVWRPSVQHSPVMEC